jgi:hypothetical protein
VVEDLCIFNGEKMSTRLILRGQHIRKKYVNTDRFISFNVPEMGVCSVKEHTDTVKGIQGRGRQVTCCTGIVLPIGVS